MVDNTLCHLHNSSHSMKAKFINFFIIHILIDFLLNYGLFLARFHNINRYSSKSTSIDQMFCIFLQHMVRNSNSFLPSDSRDCHSLVQCRRPRLEKRFIDSLYIAYTALLNFQANTMYHQSASLPSQYTCTIESMYTVYCLYLPNLVKAG